MLPPPRRARDDSPAWRTGGDARAIGSRVFSLGSGGDRVARPALRGHRAGRRDGGGAITVAPDAYCNVRLVLPVLRADFNGQKVEYRGDELFCQNSRPR